MTLVYQQESGVHCTDEIKIVDIQLIPCQECLPLNITYTIQQYICFCMNSWSKLQNYDIAAAGLFWPHWMFLVSSKHQQKIYSAIWLQYHHAHSQQWTANILNVTRQTYSNLTKSLHKIFQVNWLPVIYNPNEYQWNDLRLLSSTQVIAKPAM